MSIDTPVHQTDRQLAIDSCDTAEHRRAEEALRASEERFRSLVQHSSDTITILESDATIRYVSPSVERMLGYQPEDLVGRCAFDFIHPDDLPKVMDVFAEGIQTPGAIRSVEYRFRHRDGSWRSLESTGSNLLDSPGVMGVVVNSRDVTERKRAEEALQRAKDELEKRVHERTADLSKANEQLRAGRERLQVLSKRLIEVQEAERRHFARELHDEIGQTLTGLKLLLEMSARSPVEHLREKLDDACALVNDLMARVRELSLDLRPAMLDDLGLLPALLWHFERYTTQTDVRVDFKHVGLERRLAPEVETAAYRIVQEALTNVARHAGVQDVVVRLRIDRGMLEMRIEDHGAGFDAQAAQAAGRSTGLLGMHERAWLAGGHLAVESTPGTGTRLTASLPLAEPGDLSPRSEAHDDDHAGR